MPPILFLDVDDVICSNAPYGGYDVLAPDRPADLWQKLFHPAAVETLLQILNEHRPQVVLTTSWLRMMDRDGFEILFSQTGLDALSQALHPTAWEAPQARGKTRLEAIEEWLAANRKDEPFVILDDCMSGTGLIDSSLFNDGRVVLCELNVGLTADHLATVRRALAR